MERLDYPIRVKSPWNWKAIIENKVSYHKITKEFEWLSNFESLKIPFLQVRYIMVALIFIADFIFPFFVQENFCIFIAGTDFHQLFFALYIMWFHLNARDIHIDSIIDNVMTVNMSPLPSSSSWNSIHTTLWICKHTTKHIWQAYLPSVQKWSGYKYNVDIRRPWTKKAQKNHHNHQPFLVKLKKMYSKTKNAIIW